ncbi:MAG TPA: IS21 family transposase [Polyangium sp.]|nr:IS21 family transposase [Polyangium sp.]
MTTAWRNREEMIHQLVSLAKQHVSKRGIARALGISRNTVKDLLAQHEVKRTIEHSALLQKPTRLPKASKIDSFNDRILELLRQYPDITSQRIFETISDEGYEGKYTIVKKRVRVLRPPPRPAPSLTTPEYGPGEMAESDWSPYTIRYTNGSREDIHAFGYTLRYSTRKFFRAYRKSDIHALMEGHLKAFERFGGCARRCLYDSQKAVVLRWEGHQPIFNLRFLAFAAHYEFRVEAVRGDPNAKARVERGFWEFERSFLNGRSFAHFDDLQTQLAHWLDTVVDMRRRGRESLRLLHPHLLGCRTQDRPFAPLSVDMPLQFPLERAAVSQGHGVMQLPPQSMPISLPFWTASLHAGATQIPAIHTPL